MTSLREFAWAVDEGAASLLFERKTCVAPLVRPVPRRLLSEGLIVVLAVGRGDVEVFVLLAS